MSSPSSKVFLAPDIIAVISPIIQLSNPTKELESNQNQLVKQYDKLIEVANKIALNVEGDYFIL